MADTPRPGLLRRLATNEDVRFALDLISKLTPIAVVVVGAWIANGFQREISGTTLLSQREQAETQLRSSMFKDLVQAVVDPRTRPEWERVSVELLALNFHEHFEAKPLLVELDRALARNPGKVEDVQYGRRSLRSVARRVVDRQLASIIRESRQGERPGDWARVDEVTVFQPVNTDDERALLETIRSASRARIAEFLDPIDVDSPDRAWKLTLYVTEADWANEIFKIEGSVQLQNQSEALRVGFTLTWFDFPLTDNTVLADGNRFALVLSSVDTAAPLKSARLKVVWFPKRYFTPRERPLDYRRFLDLVGKTP
jgi:hypothetical protein